jgi:adenosyl cobinamide kinase/adenosyl cobinamide phosphate guanylyltransferase
MDWLLAQGKLSGKQICDGAVCEKEAVFGCDVLNGLQAYVRRFADELDTDFAVCLMEKNPDIIVVTDEIGCGIVPLEKEDRSYRELHGRICCKLAQEAQQVTRVICGIGSRIK